jgi:hypothetical protein
MAAINIFATEVMGDIEAERSRQNVLYGGITHDDAHSGAEWVANITKQLGQVSAAVLDEDIERTYRQAIQVAATAVAFAESLNRQGGRP